MNLHGIFPEGTPFVLLDNKTADLQTTGFIARVEHFMDISKTNHVNFIGVLSSSDIYQTDITVDCISLDTLSLICT